ncbi:MAG: hypothetical protein U0R80_17310 [Nocardioidaceae bacterium]
MSRRPRTRRTRTGAALVGAVLALASSTACSGDASDGGGSASCASVLRWDGRDYAGHGEQVRQPADTPELGTGVFPGCDDGNGASGDESGSVFRLPGVPPERAVLTARGVFVAGDLDAEPLRLLFEELPCTLADDTTVAGRATGILPAGSTGHLPEPPYRLRFEVDGDERVLGDEWAWVSVLLRVTPDTDRGTDEGLVVASVQQGRLLRVTVRCAGDGWVATALSG